MSSKPTVSAIHALVLLAVIAIAPITPTRGDNADLIGFSRQCGAASALSAPPPSVPTIVAQGRCYNGRCY
jgi:hypothetical protein